MNNKEFIGNCTMCGAENVKVTIIDDEEHVCDECLDNEFFYCEECHEHWRCDAVDSFELKDGRTICEHCAEDFDEEDIVDEDEKRINELLEAISDNDEYNGCVFEAPGIYFVIGNGSLWEISDDASCSPRGGWFPDIVKGPSAEEAECLSAMMEAMEFDEDFFRELIDDCGEFDEEYVEAYFEENDDEDSLKIYRKIKKKIDGGKTPFASVNDFASALGRYGLDSDCLYYEWEGEYIDLHDNICETGESRGYYDSIDAADWIEILENIGDHIVGA
jgi:hypothetical protein